MVAWGMRRWLISAIEAHSAVQKERQTPRALLHKREKTPLKARFVCALRRTVEENERGDVLWTVIKVGPHEAIAIDLREEMRVSSADGEGGEGAWKRGGKAGRSGRVDRVAMRRRAPCTRGGAIGQHVGTQQGEREAATFCCATVLRNCRRVAWWLLAITNRSGRSRYEIATRPARCGDTQGGSLWAGGCGTLARWRQ